MRMSSLLHKVSIPLKDLVHTLYIALFLVSKRASEEGGHAVDQN